MKKKNQWNCLIWVPNHYSCQVFSFLTEDSSLTLHRLETQVLPPPSTRLKALWQLRKWLYPFPSTMQGIQGTIERTGLTHEKSHHHGNQTDTVKSFPFTPRTPFNPAECGLRSCPQGSCTPNMFLLASKDPLLFYSEHQYSMAQQQTWTFFVFLKEPCGDNSGELRAARGGCGHSGSKNIMNTHYTEFGRCPAVFLSSKCLISLAISTMSNLEVQTHVCCVTGFNVCI